MNFSILALLVGVIGLTMEAATSKKPSAKISALLNEFKKLAGKLNYEIYTDATTTYVEKHIDDNDNFQTDYGRPISAIAVFQFAKICLEKGFELQVGGQLGSDNTDTALNEYNKTILSKTYFAWVDGRNRHNIIATKKTTNRIIGFGKRQAHGKCRF
ncbi:hypothetical protein M3Y98_00678900 [Aphelenchoides besseyi]|nr:hypothetical protein M3Y98_00678900 [Aphelenchoides besseyi]